MKKPDINELTKDCKEIGEAARRFSYANKCNMVGILTMPIL